MKRFPLPDLMKGVAVFLIIPVHILETFIDSPGRESLFGKTLLLLGGPIAVPVFMMIMGYFLAMSKKSFSKNLVRGIFIFILGFVLNIGLNFNLLLKIKYQDWQFDPLQFIFGVDIFYLAGLSIIVMAVLKTITIGQKWIVLALIFFISAMTSYVNEIQMVSGHSYILPFIGGKYSWSYFPLFPWLTYPLIGFLFQKEELRIRELIKNYKVVSILLLTIVTILVIMFSRFGVETTINLSEYYHHTFLFFLWTLGIDIIWIVLIWFIIQKFPDSLIILFLKWLGKNITVFYIFQWLIIGNIATSIYQTQELSKYILWFIPIFFVTAIMTRIVENLRKPSREFPTST